MAFYLIFINFFFLPLLIILLLLLVNGGLGNSVQIPLAALGDPAATLVLVVLKHADLLERLQHLTVDRAGAVNVVGGAVAAVLGRAVDLAETVDTESLAEVDVTGDASGADVVPIEIHCVRPFFLPASTMCICMYGWSYQSASWGGSSFELEVLTVSTHPGMGSFP